MPFREHYMINDRVRPTLEILEPDSTGPGFQLAAIVYGDTKEMVRARAELVAKWLTIEGSRRALRKKLRWAAIYMWSRRMHYRKNRAPHWDAFVLINWLVGCVVDVDGLGTWLSANWPRREKHP